VQVGDELVRQYCDGCGAWVTVTATRGVFASDVGRIELEDVDVAGFASEGVLVVGPSDDSAVVGPSDRTVSWVGGSVTGGLGTGVSFFGSDVDLEDVQIAGTLQGRRLRPAFGLFASAVDPEQPPTLTTQSLRVEDTQGYGAVQLRVRGRHRDIDLRRNGNAGLWIGAADGVEVDGGLIEGNALSGMLVSESRSVRIANVEIRDTVRRQTTLTQVVGPSDDRVSETVELGDGVHLVESFIDIRLDSVALVDNARAGVVVDLGAAEPDAFCGPSLGICLTGVDVRGGEGSFGVFSGVTSRRDGPAIALSFLPADDAGWSVTEVGVRSGSGALEAVGVVGPSDTPPLAP
jgi:hypothetical protein